jgi:catechol 2,3-dioxygenase-like lactoylglutathione lyase family enzyme
MGVSAGAPSAIHHVALRVSDLERARRFYCEVLGLREARRFDDGGVPRSIWLRVGPAMLMLETRLKGAGSLVGSGHVLALAVDDLRAWETKLAAGGVAIEDRTAATLFLRDPDGHRVALSVYAFDDDGA